MTKRVVSEPDPAEVIRPGGMTLDEYYKRSGIPPPKKGVVQKKKSKKKT